MWFEIWYNVQDNISTNDRNLVKIAWTFWFMNHMKTYISWFKASVKTFVPHFYFICLIYKVKSLSLTIFPSKPKRHVSCIVTISYSVGNDIYKLNCCYSMFQLNLFLFKLISVALTNLVSTFSFHLIYGLYVQN